MEGSLFILHLDCKTACAEGAPLMLLFLRLCYLVTLQLQHSYGIIAIPSVRALLVTFAG